MYKGLQKQSAVPSKLLILKLLITKIKLLITKKQTSKLLILKKLVAGT